MAAAFRSIGVDARVSPPSDEATLAISAKVTTGEECLPQRVVLGNFLKVLKTDDQDTGQTAFFLPTSSGPCRFGQYAPFLRKVLKDMKHDDVLVFSPTSSDGYESIAANKIRFLRTAWRAIVISDILRKLLLYYRPYERDEGATENVHTACLDDACTILSDGSLRPAEQRRRLVGSMEGARDRFRDIPLKETLGSRPLIGAVGEIYLRFNAFSNQEIIRRIERLGGEVWIADISEWVWYTNCEEKRKLREHGKGMSFDMLDVVVRHRIQHRDEKTLWAPLEKTFASRRDVHVERLLEFSRPYLPSNMALGEMTLNAGNAVAFYRAGCDGVVDISPFTCMNGIVTEVIYPMLSKDHDDIPIRIFYFDGVPFDLDRDLEIFMEQVKAYRRKKPIHRFPVN